MHKGEVSIADAKTRFSELINKVVYGHEEIIITKRGKPVAVLSAPEKKEAGLASVKGWLKEDDDFLKDIDRIVGERYFQNVKNLKIENWMNPLSKRAGDRG